MCFFCTDNKIFFCAQRTVFLSFAQTRKSFLCNRTMFLFLHRQQSLSCARELFLSFAQTRKSFLRKRMVCISFAQTTNCFLCRENSVSYDYIDDKVFLIQENGMCFLFFFHRQQSLSCAQKTVFLSFEQTTKSFLCKRTVFLLCKRIVSFICTDKKVFSCAREWYLFLLHRQQIVSCAQKTVFLSFT